MAIVTVPVGSLGRVAPGPVTGLGAIEHGGGIVEEENRAVGWNGYLPSRTV